VASIKSILRERFPPGTLEHWVLSGFFSNPLVFPISVFRSLAATRKLTGRFMPLKVRLDRGQKLDIFRSRNAEVVIDGILRVGPWGGCRMNSSISLSDGAELRILGNFEIGPGVHISVARNATLKLGGQRLSTASGITANSRIMVEKSIEIGADCIIAWDVFISDSNWHDIKGTVRCQAIVIGDNVWIAHGASIAKGANVPSGCIVGAKSLVARREFPENSLIAGVPATVRRIGIEWSR
jgi:acetyltransferase-like isoleucine patch superfamily enzyme